MLSKNWKKGVMEKINQKGMIADGDNRNSIFEKKKIANCVKSY